MAWPFTGDDVPDPLLDHATEVWHPLARSVRDLVDACVQSEVEDEEVRAAQADVEAAVARLNKVRMTTTMGQSRTVGSQRRSWANPVIGLRNPIAPPLQVHTEPNGPAVSEFHLGPAYEGPPGLVHGGVVSLILDQVLGHAVGASGPPGMTGTLTITYRHGTPLGDLRAEAWVERREREKIWASATMSGPVGVTAEATGLFIVPRAFRTTD